MIPATSDIPKHEYIGCNKRRARSLFHKLPFAHHMQCSFFSFRGHEPIPFLIPQTANITFLSFFLSNPQVLLITPGVHQGWYLFDSTCTTESAAGEAAAQSLVLPKGHPLLGAGAMEPPPDLSWPSFYIILCLSVLFGYRDWVGDRGIHFSGQLGRGGLWTRIRFYFNGLGFYFAGSSGIAAFMSEICHIMNLWSFCFSKSWFFTRKVLYLYFLNSDKKKLIAII